MRPNGNGGRERPRSPRVLKATDAAIATAADVLRSGGLVAFPTETVYGLGAMARDPQAVQRIFRAKGRPADHPLIVHLAEPEWIGRWAEHVPAEAETLATAFWPGPLTLILRRAHGVPDVVTGGAATVGLRMPAHPVAQALIGAVGDGVAAPSANRFGKISPTRAEHVASEFAWSELAWPDVTPTGHVSSGPVSSELVSSELAPAEPASSDFASSGVAGGESASAEVAPAGLAAVQAGNAIDLILDGGPCRVGVESTIIDLSSVDRDGGSPRLLRPGGVALEAIEDVLGVPIAGPTAGAPRAPGTLASHYAPGVPTLALRRDGLLDGLEPGDAVLAFAEAPAGASPAAPAEGAAGGAGGYGSGWHGSGWHARAWRVLPGDPAAAARELYAALRALDALEPARILIELPPDTPPWRAVRDRIVRASGPR